MNENPQLNEESSSVQSHLSIVQDVIQRMAENSRSCKVWCVTLVAAILVVVARTEQSQHALIALVPTLLFLFLDSYYLALERAFRKSYEDFVSKFHEGKLNLTDIYKVVPTSMGWRLVLRSMFGSISILPFYILVTVTILLTWWLIIPSQVLTTQ